MSTKKKSFGSYANGISKRRCEECPYMKVKYGKDHSCQLYNKNNETLGIYFWYEYPHPKCPLKDITFKKLLGISHKRHYKEGWAYYKAKELGLPIPELSDTHQKNDIKIKGGKEDV